MQKSRVGQAKRSPTTHFSGYWWDCASLVPPYNWTLQGDCDHAKGDQAA